jgi:hypothetical protein
MMIYSALIDAPDMAKFFWENSRTPIATSLIAHKVDLNVQMHCCPND